MSQPATTTKTVQSSLLDMLLKIWAQTFLLAEAKPVA